MSAFFFILKKDLKIKINGITLDVVNKSKFLGVVIDDQINWKQHILYTSKKIAKAIGIISIARRVFNKSTLKQLYYSFVYPYLIFGNIVWGRSGDTILWPIFRLQKIIIRMMNNVSSRNRSTPYFNEMEILKLPDIHILVVGVFMHKFKTNKLPEIFSDFFTSNSEHHEHATRGASKLRPPKVKLRVAHNFVKRLGVNLWNKLEATDNFNLNLSVCTFKKHLKRYILTTANELT